MAFFLQKFTLILHTWSNLTAWLFVSVCEHASLCKSSSYLCTANFPQFKRPGGSRDTINFLPENSKQQRGYLKMDLLSLHLQTHNQTKNMSSRKHFPLLLLFNLSFCLSTKSEDTWSLSAFPFLRCFIFPGLFCVTLCLVFTTFLSFLCFTLLYIFLTFSLLFFVVITEISR